MERKDSYLIMVDNTWTMNRHVNQCRYVIVKALPNNLGTVWMNLCNTAKAGFCFPVDPGDSIEFPLSSLEKIDFSFDNATDKLAMLFTMQEMS